MWEELLEIREEIREFILDNFMMGMKGDKLNDSDSLLDKGIIDSTGILELVGFLEGNYQIKVEDEDLMPQNFDSVDNLINYLEIKSKRA
jgi:acyl carrier protein